MANTIYEVDINDLPHNVSITMTPELEALVQEESYEAPAHKKPSFVQRLSAFALAALLAVLPVYAGCDGNHNGDAISPVPSSYNVGNSITPASGSGVGPGDDPLEIGVDTPALAPACSDDDACAAEAASGLDVVIEATYDNGTPGNAGDDETVTVASHTGVPFGSYTSGTATLSAAHGGAGLADGEGIEAHVALTFTDSKGESHTIEGTANYTYEAGPTGPRVTGCNVTSSNVGVSLSIHCTCSETADSFSLTGGPADARIFNDGTIITTRTLEASDVGLQTYDVSCTVGGVTCPVFSVTAPVDAQEARGTYHCADGTNYVLLQIETSVDAIRTRCRPDVDPGLIPNSSSEPDLTIDVDAACAEEENNSLPADERAAQEFYNDGLTVEDVYSSCTVDFVQLSYHSDN
ncbi:hypothetical protein JW898_05485 [Candidatus Woesearchaeota archaeon]|nr:hypothetical protein [Candidatus Woesearchaeota archaeon]